MAEYFFEFGFVARSGGKGGKASRNSIAKAAYDSREKLIDERTGEVFDYRWKGMPEWTGIFLPQDAPKWMRNRSQLWNELEKREDKSTRPDSAQPARAWKIGIPREFDTEEKRERFVIDYGRTLSRQGYLADLAIHAPEGSSPNYHIHAQLVLREITPEGFGKKIRIGDPKSGMSRTEEMLMQKENFVKLAARHLERYGHNLEADRFRVAHLTIDRQKKDAERRKDWAHARKLDREPTIHMGPAAWAMEKDGIRTRKGDINREIKARNHERQTGRTVTPNTHINRKAERAAGRALMGLAGVVTNSLESFLSPVLTPQEKEIGRLADLDRKLVGEAAEQQRQRESFGRDR